MQNFSKLRLRRSLLKNFANNKSSRNDITNFTNLNTNNSGSFNKTIKYHSSYSSMVEKFKDFKNKLSGMNILSKSSNNMLGSQPTISKNSRKSPNCQNTNVQYSSNN